MTIQHLLKKIKEIHPRADTDLVYLAYDFAVQCNKNEKRDNGETHIQHSLHTALTLTRIKADLNTIIAGILHNTHKEKEYGLENIKKNFGEEIFTLLEGLAKLEKIKYRGIKRYRESLRKMFLATADDIRVILIKFAERLHNLRTLDSLPEEKQTQIAQETLEIYAPVAELLGIWRLKWQMEDLCFKYLYPEEFKKIEYKFEVEKKTERTRLIQKIKNILNKKLERENIEAKIEGRFKHLYSIYRKMQNKKRKFDEIHDVFALRVVVSSIPECYKTLGVIHDLWKPKPNRFKDYIAVPKPNGYRSLHTTVFGPSGEAIEFQIRTREMDDEAQYGIAAHWHYKQADSWDTLNKPKWIKEILEVQKELKNTEDFVKKIKLDVFQNRIFVFSPQGDVFELPEGSTPVDFAYAVHTEVGNKASGALINEKMNTLDQKLKNGDLVEIIVDKNRKYPNYNWIKFVKTKRARDKIKQNSKKSTLTNLTRFFPYK